MVANTSKVGITAQQASDITSNNAKVGITTQQASDITSNNAKVGFTQALVSANADVVANTLKVGITPQQASDITDNNAKVGITTAQSNAIVANTSKISYTDAATVNALSIQVSNLQPVAYSGSYNDLTNKPTIPPAAPVDSVNSQTGVVTLETADIPESASGLFMFVTNSEKVSITSNTVKLAGIEAGAEVNNISDANATSLTNGAAKCFALPCCRS